MDVSDFSPIQNYLLVEQEDDPERTESGLHIPDNDSTCTTGIVRAAGPGYKRNDRPMRVEPGDRVLYLKASGNVFPSEGEALRLVRQTDIFATLDGALVQGAYQISS